MPVAHSASRSAALGVLLALCAGVAQAQEATVLQTENVRYDYAQVLRVTPVYQTLKATRVEQRCDPAKADSRIGRVVGAVKGALSRDEADGQAECRPVPVEREFRRPIAYDVDYVYKGARYRSRLPEDPGNRLRIRIGVTPAVPGVRTR
jgi:uncharacterized protein YcfJ